MKSSGQLPTKEETAIELSRREYQTSETVSRQSIEESKERCKTLVGFIRECWHVLEPVNPYVHGWHVDAIAEHLTAVTTGDIIRLLMNVPPGTMKSLLTSVIWPAWEWGPMNMPYLRFFTTSHALRYVTRDTRKMRDLVMSEWFQARWPHVNLIRTAETSFENTMRGWREGVPFSGLTSGRGDRVVVDDPHSTESAESDADRATADRIWHESVPSRLVNPISSAIIVIMQRLRPDDISGIIINEGEPYTHLMLPMRFEPERKCYTSVGFEDPRTEPGELLFEARFPAHVVDRDERVMGTYAVAGQHQQRPTVREGGLFKASWFKTMTAVPMGTRRVRCWDIAATEEQLGNNPAWTVGLDLGRTPDGKFIVCDVVRKRVEGPEVRKLMKQVAKIDGKHIEIGFPIDPGAAGKIVAQDLTRFLAGWVTKSLPQSGDKVSRAEPVAAQAEAGNLFLLNNPDGTTPQWHKTFIDEACDFPGSLFKDQIDALSGAFSMIMEAGLFNISEAEMIMDPMRVLASWTRCCAIEVTPRRFFAVWAAYDRNTREMMVYHTYSAPKVQMAVHADILKKQGDWIPVLFDPESRKRNKVEGIKIGQALEERAVQIFTVPLDLDAGMIAMAERLDGRQLRVYEGRTDWLAEYRRFRRDEDGELLDEDDELMRCTALLALYGEEAAVSENKAQSDRRGFDPTEDDRGKRQTGY